jgi:hypothetical protein
MINALQIEFLLNSIQFSFSSSFSFFISWSRVKLQAGAIRTHKVRPLHSPEKAPDAMEASLESAKDILRALVWPKPKHGFCGRIVHQLKGDV